MGDVYEHVGQKIRELRENHGGRGVSQEELARSIKVAPNTISRWENGKYRPDLGDLDKLARFFNASILDFLPTSETESSDAVAALLRAASTLPDEDVAELQRYAEYRRAQNIVSRSKSRGGKRR